MPLAHLSANRAAQSTWSFAQQKTTTSAWAAAWMRRRTSTMQQNCAKANAARRCSWQTTRANSVWRDVARSTSTSTRIQTNTTTYSVFRRARLVAATTQKTNGATRIAPNLLRSSPVTPATLRVKTNISQNYQTIQATITVLACAVLVMYLKKKDITAIQRDAPTHTHIWVPTSAWIRVRAAYTLWTRTVSTHCNAYLRVRTTTKRTLRLGWSAASETATTAATLLSRQQRCAAPAARPSISTHLTETVFVYLRASHTLQQK